MASRCGTKKMTSENVGISKEKKTGYKCCWTFFCMAHNHQGLFGWQLATYSLVWLLRWSRLVAYFLSCV